MQTTLIVPLVGLVVGSSNTDVSDKNLNESRHAVKMTSVGWEAKGALMMRWLVALVSVVPLVAAAQYLTSDQLEADAARRRAEDQESEARRWVGKTFWYRPKPSAEFRAEMFDELPKDFPPSGTRFLPEKTTSFVVQALVRSGPETLRGIEPTYAHIRFPDGKEGFIPFDHFTLKQATRGMPEFDFEEQFYGWDPNLKRPKTAAKTSARSGASIGMTPDQVLASSWGKPRRVNRVTNPRGKMETWHYDGDNALVFLDGKLYMIHN